MNLWERYWFGPVAAVRPYLLLKATLFLLSFDAWILMTEHGGRYGVGEFNVAHFRWMDLALPVPTPSVYVGLMLLVGILAFATACMRTNRVALAVLTVLYTYGWSMSMLDSYQHHYLLSLTLFCFVFFPRLDANELFEAPAVATSDAEHPQKSRGKKGKARRKRTSAREAARRVESHSRTGISYASAWAYVMFGVTCAIVYGYTAFTKAEPDWIDGHALRRILGDAPAVMDLASSLYAEGVASEEFWKLLARGAVLVQLVLSAGYLVSTRSDEIRSRIFVACTFVFLFAALSFHGGIELLESGDDETEVLDIGWFSYYMLFAACVYFLPAKVLDAVARIATWPARRIRSKLEEAPTEAVAATDGTSGDRLGVLFIGIAAAAVIVIAGKLVDLPGSLGAGIITAVALVLGVSFAVTRNATRLARAWTAATGFAALMMWVAIASSDVRFDFYRFVGGDARRRGEYAAALEAYVKANRYAPEGKSRRDREVEMRRLLGQGE